MPTGAKGEKRPADANARAVKIATGESEDAVPDAGQSMAEKVVGRLGRRMTPPASKD